MPAATTTPPKTPPKPKNAASRTWSNKIFIPELREHLSAEPEGTPSAEEDAGEWEGGVSGTDKDPPAGPSDASDHEAEDGIVPPAGPTDGDDHDAEERAAYDNRGKGGAEVGQKKKKKKGLKPCVMSKFTVTSLDQALDDWGRLATVKTKLWVRVLSEVTKSRGNDEGFLDGLSSEQVKSFNALETAVQKAKTAAKAVGQAAARAQLELWSAVLSAHGVSGLHTWFCLCTTQKFNIVRRIRTSQPTRSAPTH